MSEKRWCVTGGLDKGGILVRTGQDIKSPEAGSRLATGALVREVECVGDRLLYVKLTGEGPDEGWVTVKLKDKVLLEPAPILEPKEVAAGREAGVYTDLPAPAPSSRKVRVLCLHGTLSNSSVMQKQLKAMTSGAGEDLEFVFTDGPLVVDEKNPIIATQLETMKKFFPGETFKQWGDPLGEQLGWRTYDGLENAVEKVQEALEKESPIDAILGFSQGSNMAHIAAAQALLGKGAAFRCVVHLCTSKPGWVGQMPELFEWKLPMPALLVRGEKDAISTGTEEVAATYEAAEVAKHSDAHRPLPSKPSEAQEIAKTICGFILRHCRE